jgi:Calcineurin-like phosphoesterase
MNYDIIGDIHGQAEKLVNLLKKMGYRKQDGVWQHPERQAIFLGDFIDRGQHQLATVNIARDMVEAGSALAILGNHELNAIAWHTPHPDREGEYLRSRSPHHEVGIKNRKQHEAFLYEVEHLPDTHKDIIDWFLTLPLWLDLPGIRVVHACWHQQYIDKLKPHLTSDTRIPLSLMHEATNKQDSETPSIFEAVETLCKGMEIDLPPGHSFIDKYGHERFNTRVRWWDKSAKTFRQAAILPDERDRQKLPDLPIPEQARLDFPGDKPIFFGHYWMTGTPSTLSDKVACLDYSAGKGGDLVAYRWDGETKLDNSKFMF